MTHFFVPTDPNKDGVRVIAVLSKMVSRANQGDVLVSLDGFTFIPVLFNGRNSGPGYFDGSIIQPALGIDNVGISYADGKLTLEGVDFVRDEKIVIGEVINKPVMRVIGIVETYAGFYVMAQEQITGQSHDFLSGKPLVGVSGFNVRDGNVVVRSVYEGHLYEARGGHMNVSSQIATFDSQPAKILDPTEYEVTFADDLSTVTVVEK